MTKEERKVYYKAYCEKNKEILKEKRKAYYDKNRERMLEYTRRKQGFKNIRKRIYNKHIYVYSEGTIKEYKNHLRMAQDLHYSDRYMRDKTRGNNLFFRLAGMYVYVSCEPVKDIEKKFKELMKHE